MSAFLSCSRWLLVFLGATMLFLACSDRARAQTPEESFAFHTYCWRCSRSFRTELATNERSDALQAAWDRRLGDSKVVVIETRGMPSSDVSAWSLNFGREDQFPNVKRFVLEKVDGQWREVAAPASRREADELATELAEKDRPAVVLLRIEANGDSGSK